jgi:hypothetical protein
MWKPETERLVADRSSLRYPSHLTDTEWAGFLCPMDRASVEGVAQRPAAEEHGARLSGTVELGGHVGALRVRRRGEPDALHQLAFELPWCPSGITERHQALLRASVGGDVAQDLTARRHRHVSVDLHGIGAAVFGAVEHEAELGLHRTAGENTHVARRPVGLLAEGSVFIIVNALWLPPSSTGAAGEESLISHWSCSILLLAHVRAVATP